MAHILASTGALLDVVDLFDDGIQGLSHLLVHGHRVVAFNEVRLPGAATEEALHLFMGHTAEDGGVRDLVAIQVQDGQNSAVTHGVQELVGLPAGGQGPVSASPSPTVTAQIRSGLSNTAPNACAME